MKRFLLLLAMLSIGMSISAQIDTLTKSLQRDTPRYFLNDRELFGSIGPLDPTEIVGLEVDKELDAVKVYTAGRVKEVITLDRYLRKRFKNYERNFIGGGFVDRILVDDPSHSIIWPEVIKSVAILFDRDGGLKGYRIETFDADRKPVKGGIRIRGNASL